MPAPDYIPGVNELIHLIYPDKNGKIPTQKKVFNAFVQTDGAMHAIACDPAAEKLPRNASSETEAVNCPRCKKSEAFKKIQLEQQSSGMSETDRAVLEEMLATASPVSPASSSSASE